MSKLGKHISMAIVTLGMCSCNSSVVRETLPVVSIEAPIEDTDLDRTDVPCIFTAESPQEHTMLVSNAKIHLRGNSTSQHPRKPFHVKLSTKEVVLGMPAARSWVLLSNFADATMLRNAVALRMAYDSRLEWTPYFRFVDLFYNNHARGIYQICEKVQVQENRVLIPEDGWLVEVDARAPQKDDPWFRIHHLEHPVKVHKMQGSWTVESLQTLFEQTDEVLFSAQFCDPENGWRRYLDETSWIDWYVLNELAKNNDAYMFSSCFMHSGTDGKIVMGPVWDFDLAFGNTPSNGCDSPIGFHVRIAMWFNRLLQDPLFAQQVNERFAYFIQRENIYQDYIRQNAQNLLPYMNADDTKRYNNDTKALQDWIHARFAWITQTIEE